MQPTPGCLDSTRGIGARFPFGFLQSEGLVASDVGIRRLGALRSRGSCGCGILGAESAGRKVGPAAQMSHM